jgi:hypothetical protein
MNEFLNSFSNREISIVFWTAVLIVLAVLASFTGFKHLVKSFFAKKLFCIYFIIGFYFYFIISALIAIGAWETSLYKDFIFWILTTAGVLLLNFNNLKSYKDFKNVLLQMLTIQFVMEFVVGVYNLSLWAELLLIPIVTFISLMVVVAGYKKQKENQQALYFLNTILSLIGISIFVFVVFRVITTPDELMTIANLKSFLFSPLFTFLFLPLLLLIVVYAKYELIFGNINRYKFLDRKRKRKIKLAFLQFGNLNPIYLENAHNITIWRKYELSNEIKLRKYIKHEIKRDVKFNE